MTRLGAARMLSDLVSPPAYDEISMTAFTVAPANVPHDPPPPYVESELAEPPPPYESQQGGGDAWPSRAFGLLGGRPPVRWNCDMRVEQWTSASSWSIT
jgi:hypothetical protein